VAATSHSEKQLSFKTGEIQMSRGFLRYKAYPFREKDPIIDVLRTIKQDGDYKDSTIHENGGPAVATMRGWFVGATRRPQFATVAAAAMAMGVDNLPLTSEGRRKMKR
jgi:hypothetical protein